MGALVFYFISGMVAISILFLIWMILCCRYISDIIDRKNRSRVFNRLFWKLFAKEDSRLESLLDEVLLRSTFCGFPSMFISIYRISFLIPTTFAGEIHQDNLRAEIFMSGFNIWGFTDEKIRAIMAHEVGHYIEYKTHRIGHPIFERIRKLKLDKEEFAWFIAMYLYPDISEFFEDLEVESTKLKNLEFTSSHIVKKR